MSGKNDITMEKMARMIGEGFKNTATKSDMEELKSEISEMKLEVREGFEKVREEFGGISKRLFGIEKQLKDFIERDEFDDLMSRVKYLEMKLGVESGK